MLGVDANASYSPESIVPPHPLEYNPDVPTLSASHTGKLSTLIATCGLRDPLALQHESRPFPASHMRGSQRIDFLLVTPRLADEFPLDMNGLQNLSSRFNVFDIGNYVLIKLETFRSRRPN